MQRKSVQQKNCKRRVVKYKLSNLTLSSCKEHDLQLDNLHEYPLLSECHHLGKQIQTWIDGHSLPRMSSSSLKFKETESANSVQHEEIQQFGSRMSIEYNKSGVAKLNWLPDLTYDWFKYNQMLNIRSKCRQMLKTRSRTHTEIERLSKKRWIEHKETFQTLEILHT